MLANWPVTLLIIMPVNRRLMAMHDAGPETRAMIVQWGGFTPAHCAGLRRRPHFPLRLALFVNGDYSGEPDGSSVCDFFFFFFGAAGFSGCVFCGCAAVPFCAGGLALGAEPGPFMPEAPRRRVVPLLGVSPMLPVPAPALFEPGPLIDGAPL